MSSSFSNLPKNHYSFYVGLTVIHYPDYSLQDTSITSYSIINKENTKVVNLVPMF